MFGVKMCKCEDPLKEVLNGVAFCEDCKGSG